MNLIERSILYHACFQTSWEEGYFEVGPYVDKKANEDKNPRPPSLKQGPMVLA